MTEPLQPIINILDTQIPGLDAIGIKESLVGLFLAFTGNSDEAQPVQDFFDAITAINNFSIDQNTGMLTIPVIQPFQIQLPDFSGGTAVLAGSAQSDDANPADDSSWTGSPLGQLDDGDQSIFSFPFFQDPVANIIPLLLGTAADSVDPPVLFEITTPKVSLSAGTGIPIGSIPPWVPEIKLDISATLSMQLAVGYDITGLLEIAQTNSPTGNQIASDILDGFFIDDNSTSISLTGSIGLEADAYIVSIAGDIEATLSLSPAPTNGFDRTYLSQLGNESFGQIFNLSGDIALNFQINVGVELGFVTLNAFSINIGPITLFSFGTQSASPQVPDTAPTIFINETNANANTSSNKDKGIVVHETTLPDFNPFQPDVTIEAIEVDYPDGTKDIYPTGAIDTTTNQPLKDNPWPQYTQIVTETNGSTSSPEMDPTAITQGQSIVIDSNVVSYNASDQPEPVNAVLIGGEGDDDLEYYASGSAILIGNGGNNTLIGGSKGTVYAFGDLMGLGVRNPLLSPPAWYTMLPTWLQNEISLSEFGNPSDVGTNQVLGGSGNGDFLEGGACHNSFQESGSNFNIVTEGSQSNAVQIASPSRTSSGSTIATGAISFTNADPLYSTPQNTLGLSPDATDDLVLTGVPGTDVSGAYLQVAGTETYLQVLGDVQDVSVAVAGGTLEIGDMSALPTLTSILIEEDSGVFSSDPIMPGVPNTIVLDPPASGAAAINISGDPVVEEDAQDGGGFPNPLQQSFYDLDVQDPVSNAHVIFQGLTDQDTVDLKMLGGTAVVQPPTGAGYALTELGDLGLEKIELDGSLPFSGDYRPGDAITIHGGPGDNLVMSNGGPASAILSDNETIDGETVAGIDIFAMGLGDETTIYGGTPVPGDFFYFTDTFNFDASALGGTLNLYGGYGSLGLQAMVDDDFTITNVGSNLTTNVTGGGATNTFDIVHNDDSSNQNIFLNGGPGGAASNTLILDREQTSVAPPDDIALSAFAKLLDGKFKFYEEATGTDTSVQFAGIYSIDVNMNGGTFDSGSLDLFGANTIDVNAVTSPTGDPNHVIIEPDAVNKDHILVDTGLSINDVGTDTQYTITGLAAQDDVRIKLNGGGSETVFDAQTLGPYALIFDGSAAARAGNTLEIPITAPNFDASVTTDTAGDAEFQIGGGIVAFHDPIPTDRIIVDDYAETGTSDFFDVSDATALVGTLQLWGNQAAGKPVNDTFEVDSTPAANLTIEIIGGDGVNNYDFYNLGYNVGIAIVGGYGDNLLTLYRTQTSPASPDSVTLGTVSAILGPELSVTGTTTSIVATGVTDITDNMYGGTLDVDDLAAIGYTNISVVGLFRRRRTPIKS